MTTVLAGGMRTRILLERFPDLDPGLPQDPGKIADTERSLLTLPAGSVIAEIRGLRMRERSCPGSGAAFSACVSAGRFCRSGAACFDGADGARGTAFA